MIKAFKIRLFQFLICNLLSCCVNSQSFLKSYLYDSSDPPTTEDFLKSDRPHPWKRINSGLCKINMYDDDLFV